MHGPEHRNGNGAHADAGECIRDAPVALGQPHGISAVSERGSEINAQAVRAESPRRFWAQITAETNGEPATALRALALHMLRGQIPKSVVCGRYRLPLCERSF